MITAIGKDLKGDKVLDASGCYVMPGGIDPHTHLEMPFMGTTADRGFLLRHPRRRSPAAPPWWSISSCPAPNQSLIDALQAWHQKAGKAAGDYSFHMAITWWGEQVWKEMEEVVKRGVNTFKHFMAYKGALMVNDDEMYQSFLRCAELGALPLVHAENGDVVARLQQKYMSRGHHRPRGPRLFASARGRGRGDQPRHHDRRCRPACRSTSCTSPARTPTRRSAGRACSAAASSASR